MKMEKTPRYTQRERNMVLGYAAQYKDVIENKRTDAESNRKKDEVWRQIAKEFNARVYHQRSAKQLRQLYKNMKLLLKKDLCGDDKGNRTFMDLLNTLSQQDSVAQYITEQMSPGSFSSNGRHQKYDDDYDDSKMPSVGGFGTDMDADVIVIKSEDISDNEHSQNHDEMDEDDDDCLSAKDIPEVCLEEEDDEIFATEPKRSPANPHNIGLLNQAQQQQEPKPEITIQNVGNIRVGSIGSLANLSKALQSNAVSAALSIGNANNNNNHNSSSNNNNSINNNNNNGSSSHSASIRQTSAEQAQQQLLLSGLGLSAVHQTQQQQQQQQAALAAATTTTPQMPTLQRGGSGGIGSSTNHLHNNNNNSSSNHHHHTSNNSTTNAVNQLLLNLANSNNFNTKLNGLHINSSSSNSHNHNHGSHSNGSHSNTNHYSSHHSNTKYLNNLNNSSSSNNNNNNSSSNNNSNNNNSNNGDYLMFLEIEEKRRKIDLLNAQTEYWKTLTKKLETNNSGHYTTPTCGCHFSSGSISNGLPAKAGNNS